MHRYTAVLLLFSCFPHRKDYENIFLNLPKWEYCLQEWSGLFCWFVTLKSYPRDILKTDRGKGKFFPLGFLTVTDPFRQSVKHIYGGKDTPPDGSGLTWSNHYHFAYENKMRCDNWSLMYFSSRSHDTISTASFKGKNTLRQSSSKAFFNASSL